MKDLKEINMGQNMVTLKDNHVTSSILPKNTHELSQNITIAGDVIIDGAVYTNTLEISNGPAEFLGALFANSELHIKNDSKGLIHFHKAVASANSVVALLINDFAIFSSDINSPIIKLKNVFVAGSIYGTDITLENCVVLGGVFASKTLEVNSCILGTFNSSSVRAGGVNYLLYPTAFSVEPMTILPGTQWWNLSLADLGALFNGEKPQENTGKLLIDILNDTQRTVLTDNDGTQTLINSYSVASRVLVSDLIDYDKMKNHFLIVGAALGEQLLKSYAMPTSNGSEGGTLSIEKIARFFFDLLSGKIEISEISGKVSFDALSKNI